MPESRAEPLPVCVKCGTPLPHLVFTVEREEPEPDGGVMPSEPVEPLTDSCPPMPTSQAEWEVHWAFYKITVAQRNLAWRELERLKGIALVTDDG